MNSLNFGKPLQEISEQELFNLINNSDPRFGNLAQYELMRRLSLKNEESSKRFAFWSLFISVVALFVSLSTSLIQIYITLQK